MANPLISIIVPVYNTEEYIETCVDALLSQTYDNIQVVLVDDGSKDSSPKLCDELATRYERVKTVHQENSGIYRARLKGVSVADGDYIGFTDSDDYIEPDMYEILMRNMIEADADISHCGYKMIRGDKETPYYGTGKRITQDREAGIKDLLEGKFIEPTLCTKLYKKELFDGVDSPCRIDYFEDVMLNFQLFQKANKAVFEDVMLYHYIKRETSISRSIDSDKYCKDFLTVKQQLEKPCVNDKKIKKYGRARNVSQWVNGYKLLLSCQSKDCERWYNMAPAYSTSFNIKMKIKYYLLKIKHSK